MPQKYRKKKKTDGGSNQELQSYLQPGTLKYDLTAPKSRRSDDWLITYTDMVTLLITLFIVMLAHSTFEKKEGGLIPLLFENYTSIDELKSNIGDSNHLSQGDVIYLGDFPEPGKMAERTKDRLSKSANDLRKSVEKLDLSDSIEIEIISGDIEIHIYENVLFPTAQTELLFQGEAFLASILPTLHEGDFEITIEGHIDNVLISTEQSPPNWELPAARALSIVHYLENQGILSKKLYAVVHGEKHPLASNEKPEKHDKSRGMQIILR